MAGLADLLRLLDDDTNQEAVGTSIRIPKNLREAAQIAVDLGLADNVTSLAVDNLRTRLEGIAQLAVLDETYDAHPDLRPTLADLALAAADMDASPVAEHPDVIRHAADILLARGGPVEPDDVLLYASGVLDGLSARPGAA